MTNQAENLIQAIKLLPAVHEDGVGLNVPHLVVDWNMSRCINRIASKNNIATHITTMLEPLNRGRLDAQMTYHVFHITGDRKVHKSKGSKRPHVARPRPTIDIPVVIQIAKPYRRHCGGH